MNKNEYNYHALIEEENRNKKIIKENEKSVMTTHICNHSEETVLNALEQKPRKIINERYETFLFPLINNCLYVISYLLSIVYFTIDIFFQTMDTFNLFFPFIALLITIIIITVIEKKDQNKTIKTNSFFSGIEKFTNETTTLSYTLTIMGFMVNNVYRIIFIILYIISAFIFIFGIVKDIIIPIIKKTDT